MKKCTMSILTVLALALFLATAASAQTTVLVGAGSSALFPSVTLSAVSSDPITGAPALCGSNLWTGGSGAANSITVAQDNRLVGGNPIPAEPGTLSVAWDNDTAPTKICAAISVDSVVGDRLFLEQGAGLLGNATLVIAPTAKFTVPANKVAFAQDNTSCAASTGSLVFNVDITETSGTTATVTVHGGGNFSNYFANGASVVIAGSSISGFNATYNGGAGNRPAIGGVTQLGPLSFTVSTAGTALGTDSGGAATATVTANCPGIPAAVYTALNNQHITVAYTDIRPEDGLYAEQRASNALNPADNTVPNMGYGNRAIKSSFSQALAFPFAFQVIAGQPDPYSGTALPSYVTQGIGAAPIVIIGNNQDNSACGLGSLKNVTWQAVSNAYTGNSEGATTDLDPDLSSCLAAMPIVEREPLSGTYNTFEFQIVRSRSGSDGRAQERGNVGYSQSNNNLGSACGSWTTGLPASAASNPVFPPAGFNANNCGNPLNIQQGAYPGGTPQSGGYGGAGGNRVRAIGTGEMVAAINSNDASAKNSLGYAFWSVGTYGKKTGLKYFTVDGVDPLWPSYSGNPYGAGTLSLTTGGSPCIGAVNLGTFSCPLGQPTFDGVKNGNYRVFSILRAVYAGSSLQTCPSPFTTLTIGCLIQAAQDQAQSNVHDFLPAQFCANGTCSSKTQNLDFFRSHYTVSGVSGHNGNQNNPNPACVGLVPLEAGGDMAGAIYTIPADYSLQIQVSCTSENTGFIQ